MVTVLIHGTGDYYKTFHCEKCGCVFKSTEYKRNPEYGNVARCPECNFPNVEMTIKQFKELVAKQTGIPIKDIGDF